jgi:hypothetical protein
VQIAIVATCKNENNNFPLPPRNNRISSPRSDQASVRGENKQATLGRQALNPNCIASKRSAQRLGKASENAY